MSLEITRTALEIYQPLIVGLGAVVIGFVANGLLEWLRAELRERSDRKVLRKALYLEISAVGENLRSELEIYDAAAEGEGFFSLKLPQYILALSPERIGVLTVDEVKALAKFIDYVDGLSTFSQGVGQKIGSRQKFSFSADQRQPAHSMIRHTFEAAKAALIELEKRF